MAIDIVARGLALSLLNDEGKLASELMPEVHNGEVTQYSVGGVSAGMSLDGKTLEEILMLMLFGVVNPTLTNPSLRVSGSPLIGVAGRPLEVTGQIKFDRGRISPANGTSGFRAGLPSFYTIGDKTQVTQETTINFSYLFEELVKGSNTLQIFVNYEEGEQPRDSAGKEFDTPFPAGQLSFVLTIDGQAPIYAGLSDGTEVSLNDAYFDETEVNNGAGYNITAEAEITEEDTWAILFPAEVAIVGVKQYDIMSQSWQWLGGSAEASLTYFNIEPIEKEVNGTMENYVSYSNALELVGERELKFYTELPKGE